MKIIKSRQTISENTRKARLLHWKYWGKLMKQFDQIENWGILWKKQRTKGPKMKKTKLIHWCCSIYLFAGSRWRRWQTGNNGSETRQWGLIPTTAKVESTTRDGAVMGLRCGEADVDETRRRGTSTGGRDLTSTPSWTEELRTERRWRIGAIRL